MADPREELVDQILSNEPGMGPSPGPLRLTVRPAGFAAPLNDLAQGQPWGAPDAETGRPGRLFEPDLSPAQSTPEHSRMPRAEFGGFQPSFIGAGQAIGRGLGSLVQGARDAFSAPAVVQPRASRDPTAGPREMWQGQYPSPEQPSLLQRGVTEGLNIPYRAVEASKGQFDPETGATDVEDRRRAQVEAASDVTTNLAGFGMTGASLRGGATAGVFGGRLSKGFDPNKEKLAELMAQNGQTPQQIWKDTGLVKFADGKWAHEIPDLDAAYAPTSAAKVKMMQGEQIFLPDVIPNHPKLYAAYPELRKMPVSHDAFMHAQGAYTPESMARGPAGQIDIQPRSIRYREQGKEARGATLDTLLHEIQHAIQQIEGMAKGSGTDPLFSLTKGTGANRYYQEEMKNAPVIISEEEFKRQYPKTTPKDYKKHLAIMTKQREDFEFNAAFNSAERAYPESAGENLANLAIDRKNLTPEQAAAIYPPSQFRLPMERQNVEYNRLTNPAGTTPQAQMGGVLGLEGPQMSAPLLRGKPGGPWEGGIRAYHSSPHDFDKFDLSKLRTGEGANMYGSGFYFAENPAVSGQGGQYWNQFSKRFRGDESTASTYLQAGKFDRERAAENLHRSIYDTKQAITNGKHSNGQVMSPEYITDQIEYLNQQRRALKLLESGAPVGPRTYEVNIKATPEQMINWDKPPVEQTPQVRNAIDAVMRPIASDYTANPDLGTRSMQSVLYDMGHPKVTGSPERASLALKDAGVPGIRYLDQGSRGQGYINGLVGQHGSKEKALEVAQQKLAEAPNDFMRETWQKAVDQLTRRDTYNYVAFDPSKLDILAKYGIVGTAGAAGMGSLVDPKRYNQDAR